MLHAVEKTFLVAQPVQLVALCKSRGMLPGGDQSVAAIANKKSVAILAQGISAQTRGKSR